MGFVVGATELELAELEFELERECRPLKLFCAQAVRKTALAGDICIGTDRPRPRLQPEFWHLAELVFGCRLGDGLQAGGNMFVEWRASDAVAV